MPDTHSVPPATHVDNVKLNLPSTSVQAGCEDVISEYSISGRLIGHLPIQFFAPLVRANDDIAELCCPSNLIAHNF